ncbi:hypothetical protein [Carboxylicivirga marina]|uniref:hypothetical protein n=1 Tax=Carboxylicivirga marina TaxID=2800988 RepID=UPI00259A6CCA|nr:hypothetical protein [uncultured Carboxylicivirga sp.]
MLIKVGPKKWIEKSFFEGSFKFGSLLGYQEIENEGSRDELEGTLSLTFALTNEETNIIGPDGKPMKRLIPTSQKNLRTGATLNIQHNANILCFTDARNISNPDEYLNKAGEFGDYCLIIKNIDQFIKRLRGELLNVMENYNRNNEIKISNLCCNRVQYFADDKYGIELSKYNSNDINYVFVKREKFSPENEYRIVIGYEKKEFAEEDVIISMGSLEGIADIIPIDKLRDVFTVNN